MKTTTVVAGAALVMLAACSTSPMQSNAGGASGPKAVANLAPTKGNQASGTVTFTQRGNKVVVAGDITGLAPGAHGFHIHDKGDCSADDATSAGGHYNPMGKPHAGPGTTERHAGDMPMINADASGKATLNSELDVVTIGGGAADIVGRAVIVHKDADDYKTQPTGNSGARVACGVIRSS